jgi:hypothetical protein
MFQTIWNSKIPIKRIKKKIFNWYKKRKAFRRIKKAGIFLSLNQNKKSPSLIKLLKFYPKRVDLQQVPNKRLLGL